MIGSRSCIRRHVALSPILGSSLGDGRMMCHPSALLQASYSRFSGSSTCTSRIGYNSEPSMVGVNPHYPSMDASRCRWFSSSSSNMTPSSQDEMFDTSIRHSGILMHPDSISSQIMPGNFVLKPAKNGKVSKRYTELLYGYFWMIKDLELSNQKPIQSNPSIIEESISKPFPALHGVRSLSGTVVVDLPEYCLRKNRSSDPQAQCTLVAMSYRDYGYQMLPSWIDPFRDAMQGKDRVEILKINMVEGWFNRFLLRPIIQAATKRNTPEQEQDSTFLYFGKETDSFRDALRLYNIMTGYVFLLDGLGRVRFAGSGPATQKEVDNLTRFARELCPLLDSNQHTRNQYTGSSSSRRKTQR